MPWGLLRSSKLVHVVRIAEVDGFLIINPLCKVKNRHYPPAMRDWARKRFSVTPLANYQRATCEECRQKAIKAEELARTQAKMYSSQRTTVPLRKRDR